MLYTNWSNPLSGLEDPDGVVVPPSVPPGKRGHHRKLLPILGSDGKKMPTCARGDNVTKGERQGDLGFFFSLWGEILFRDFNGVFLAFSGNTTTPFYLI